MNSKEITVVAFGDSLTAPTPGVRVASEPLQTFLSARQFFGRIDPLAAFAREFPSSAALETILPDGMHPGQAGHDRIARPMIALLHRQLFNTNKHEQVSL